VDLRELVRLALDEDGADRDLTTLATVPEDVRARGILLAKDELVVSGLEVAALVFATVDARAVLTALVAEGGRASRGTAVGRVQGPARALLQAERVALNLLQRLTGVATFTRRFVDAVAGTRAKIRDTRKTTPLLRALQKRAVVAGGGVSHRAGLHDAILIKDNHVRIAGSVGEATRRAVAAAASLPVEVEVEREDQIEEALAAGAAMLLLDNFTVEAVGRAVARIRGRVPVEVSGGVTLATVRAYAEAGADFISVGALTHSAPSADISLEIEELEAAPGSA
jgi:nicotinate-nucleotide pyrophosphorylase (carboxylating)